MYYIKVSLKKETGRRSNIVMTHGLKPSDTLSTVYLKHLIDKLTAASGDEAEALLSKHDFYIFVFINTDGIVFGNSVTNIAGSNLYEMGKNSRLMQKEMHVVLKQINRIPDVFLLINLSVDFSRWGNKQVALLGLLLKGQRVVQAQGADLPLQRPMLQFLLEELEVSS